MSFAEDCARWSLKARENVALAHRKIAVEMFTRVIMMSPVDTGRFRGNWQVAIGSVPTGTLELDDASGTATVAKAQAEALRLRGGETIYLANNLPYALSLEYGSSQQAPQGMVRVTVQAFEPLMAAIARELRNR